MKLHTLVFAAMLLPISPGHAADRVPTKQQVDEVMLRAMEGDSNYQAVLSGYFNDGNGVPRAPKEAVFWARQSAEQGNPAGRIMLAQAYERGEGVPQNFVQAYAWLAVGVAHGEQGYALLARDRVARKMTPADLSEAQRLAGEYFEKYGAP